MAEKISQIQGLKAELGAMIAEDAQPSESVEQETDKTPDSGAEN